MKFICHVPGPSNLKSGDWLKMYIWGSHPQIFDSVTVAQEYAFQKYPSDADASGPDMNT